MVLECHHHKISFSFKVLSIIIFIDAYNSSPFIDTYGGAIGNNALLNAWQTTIGLKTIEIYMLHGKLSDQVIDNNNRNSTWWLQTALF